MLRVLLKFMQKNESYITQSFTKIAIFVENSDHNIDPLVKEKMPFKSSSAKSFTTYSV
jgi:hypothetical protein